MFVFKSISRCRHTLQDVNLNACVVSQDKRLAWLGGHRQNVRPITDPFKMQSVSLQATPHYR